MSRLDTEAGAYAEILFRNVRLLLCPIDVGDHLITYDQREERLLKETNLPLVSVASEVGFPNQSHFTQAFKQSMGTTPHVYRQGH